MEREREGGMERRMEGRMERRLEGRMERRGWWGRGGRKVKTEERQKAKYIERERVSD